MDRQDRCQGCGDVIPRSPGRPGRPRLLCTSCKPPKKPPSRPACCTVCGGEFPPVSPKARGLGNVRLYCSEKCSKEAESARNSSCRLRECVRCGRVFSGSKTKMFCSQSCRWPKRLSTPVKCKQCGLNFVRKSHKDILCSDECKKAIRKKNAEATTQRNIARGKRCACLNCGIVYHPKSPERFKYCSRDCAFEARRLKKPCAARPLDTARSLASWFFDWGNDYWPHVYKCCECGAAMQRREGGERHEKCLLCKTAKLRTCVDCGSSDLSGPSVKRCEPCREAAKAALKKRQRRQRKRRHGNSHTIRKRCRHHNAPYTPVSRKKIFDRDNWTCQLCGMRLLARYTRLPDGGVHGLSPTVDHIIPLARGPDGPGHVESNCQAACWGCNTEKGAADPDSFAAGKATDLDSKAWQKAQHQRRSTSSRCEDQRKPTTARSLAPL